MIARFLSYLRGPCHRITVPATGVYWLAWGDGRHDDTDAFRGVVKHSPDGSFVIETGTYRVREYV